MKQEQQSIFRTSAVQRYLENHEEAVLPRFVSTPTFLYLWILLGLLVAGGVATCLVQIPIYASGSAVIVNSKQGTPGISDEVIVVGFFPPENRSLLQVGQPLYVDLDPTGTRIRRSIVFVEPAVTSPEEARQRFALSPGTALPVTRPAAVVVARLEPLSSGLSAQDYLGSVYPAEIEVGTRRLISFVPLIGRLFGA